MRTRCPCGPCSQRNGCRRANRVTVAVTRCRHLLDAGHCRGPRRRAKPRKTPHLPRLPPACRLRASGRRDAPRGRCKDTRVNDSLPLRSRVARLEAVQSMLLEVGRLACTARDLDQFLAATHAAVGRILYAANFFVALYDAGDRTLRFPYFVDEVDAPEDPQRRFPVHGIDDSPTAK